MRRFAASILIPTTMAFSLFLAGCPTPTPQYTLTYTAGVNGSITGTSPQTVNSGASGTAVTAEGDAGYQFVQWSDATIQNPRTDTDVTADVSVTATFAVVEGQSVTVMLPPGNLPLELVSFSPGTFMMGSPDSEQDRNADEGPQHQVTLTQPFWMGKYLVTQAQWQAVMGSNPSAFTGASLPVDHVSWDDCQTFIQRLNGLGQGTFRLPTEAEWEYACRTDTTMRFYWGDDPNYTEIGNYAWFVDNSASTTHPVGLFPPNAWGLYDISGNIWEWCQDWYGVYPSGAVTDPIGPATGTNRVARGGSWYSYSWYCRSASRNYDIQSDPSSTFGFRVARS